MDTNGSNETVDKMNAPTENKDIEVKHSEPSRKNSKGDKLRKKDDKSVEQVLKALNSLETTEEKLAAMCKKYTDIVDENRKLQLAAKQCEKKCCILQREKEQLQTEHSKAVLSRSRLESLCRELQRQNKAIKEESLLKVREEEEKRKEVSAKFQGTLNEITALMQQNIEKNAKLKEENVEMAQRFGKLLEQYEIREQQVEKLLEQIHIETELGEAKMAKARMEMANERELMLRENTKLLMELDECRGKVRGLQETEVGLRGQLSLYTDKYDEFQTALTRSSEVFNGFKGEMEKMSKKICKLEKETTSWKQRWERSHQALLEMAADKQQRDGELALANRRLTQMQALCRTLQGERAALLAQVRGGNEGAKDSVIKKEDGSEETIGETKDVTENDEKKEGAGEVHELKQGTVVNIVEEYSALSDPVEVDKVASGNDASVIEKKMSCKKEDNLPKETEKTVETATKVEADTNACNEASPSNTKLKENVTTEGEILIKNEPEKENISLTGKDDQGAPKGSEESNTKLDEEAKSTSELACLDLPDCQSTKEVSDANDSIAAETVNVINEELDLLKQKLDSCRLDDVIIGQTKENINSVGNVCEQKDVSQIACSEKQVEKIVSDLSAQISEVEEASDSGVKESQMHKVVCGINSDAQPKENARQPEEPCPVREHTNDSIKQPPNVGDLREGAKNDKDSNSVGTITAWPDGGDDKQESSVTSQEKLKPEPVKETAEKPVEDLLNSNDSSKKSDTAPVNVKKGKESSRKRKR